MLQEQDTLGNAVVSYLHGDDLIARTTPADTRYYHYDGLGSTRLLTDETGTETDSYTYKAYGDLEHSTETSDNAYRYAGEQYEASLGYYYLRARYYDPNLGRFTQMDSYVGDPQTPISLHKYAYANLDPALMVDPSGQFSSLGDLMTGIAGRAAISFRSLGVRNARVYIRAAIKAAKQALKRIAKNCARSRSKPKQCRLDFPLIFFGEDVKTQTEHVADAELDGKLPILSRKIPKWRPGWYRSKKGTACEGKTVLGTGKHCDEYPFNSSHQGGPQNYDRNRVSLRPINTTDNLKAGAYLGVFYRLCKVKGVGGSLPPKNETSYFGVVPAMALPITVPWCGIKK